MPPVAVRILHREPPAAAGPLERSLARVRRDVAERVAAGFAALDADAAVVARPADDGSFGARLRGLAASLPLDGGLVVLGSGAAAAARAADLAPFVATAARGERVALANNRYSADLIAVACAGVLRTAPDLATDNALPRWLEDVAGYRVEDRRDRWRLQVDVDTSLDGVLLGLLAEPSTARAAEAIGRVRTVGADPVAELLVAGRTSSRSLRWLESFARARVRALVEERGLRTSRPGQRPPASVLGMLLERDGPESLGRHVERLADGALIDSRVLLANRLGAHEASWPPAEDRYASDLLLSEQVRDPWLRALTESAIAARVPIVLGGHTLVGPGIRLALRGPR